LTLLSSVGVADESPVDRWLAEQADLTAVERFSQRHDAHVGPVQERYYRELMPAAPPAPGQQYGFAVDLDSCTGCKACVVACHSLNGLDDGEAFRRVSRISGTRETPMHQVVPFQQTVTAACHHCVDPACMNGCPVDAYEKDPVTGIVKHLDDQCIGCSYCTLTCPYEVPSMNKRLGIVRKCDMCSDRLAEGEAPACVQSCPNEAISITIVDGAAILAATRGDAVLVPGAAPSRITAPTTTYRSAKGPATAAVVHEGPAHSHPPLAVMLVLTQLAVGAFVGELLRGGARPIDATVSLAVASLAMGASVLHLGRPLYAYRAVIGIGHSWLSREIVAFGAFMGLAVPYAATVWFGRPVAPLGIAAGVVGVFGVVCSILIYSTTRRASWSFPRVAARFVGGSAVAGTTTLVWVDALIAGPWLRIVGMTLVLAGVVATQMWERLRFFTKASRPR
jgi:Fe-S-cluster-containing dehydrogenase component